MVSLAAVWVVGQVKNPPTPHSHPTPLRRAWDQPAPCALLAPSLAPSQPPAPHSLPVGQQSPHWPTPQVYVLKRPYVDEFLQRMGELFECVLFTASLAKVSPTASEVLLGQPCPSLQHAASGQ